MIDIVERLRQRVTGNMLLSMPPQEQKDGLCHAAADTIEALRAENEKLHREAAIRIDQIEREQEAHLRTISDYNRAMVKNDKLHKALKPFAYYASQIPDDVSDTCSASGTVGDLRAAAAAIRESGG